MVVTQLIKTCAVKQNTGCSTSFGKVFQQLILELSIVLCVSWKWRMRNTLLII